MKQFKILYVIHRSWPYLGGSERQTWEWAKSSRDAGYDVSIFTTDAWDIERFHDRTKRHLEVQNEIVEGIRIRRFRLCGFPNRLQLGTLKVLSRVPIDWFKYSFGYPHICLPGYLFKMLVTREHFDLIHAGVFPHLFLMYATIKYGLRRNVPVIGAPLVHLGEPNSDDIRKHFLSSHHLKLLRKCSRITAITPMERDVLTQNGIAREMVQVVSAGVTPAEVNGGVASRFRDRFGVHGKIVLQISTQTHDKGSGHVVEAMKNLWQQGLNATLVLIGQVMSDFDDYFLQQPSWVFERTVVLDYIDEQTKKDALAACDVFVMPSRADSFGIVFLEAWLYRKPVIGALAGGIPSIVEDGKDGFLVPFGDIDMLSEYIRILLDCPPLGQALGENGYRKVLRKFTWERSCTEVQALYHGLLQDTRQ